MKKEYMNKKIGIIALIFALLALSQAGAITTAFNYNFINGTNISIIDDGLGNVTISSNVTGGSISDNLKVNKSGDIMTGTLYNNLFSGRSGSNVISFQGFDALDYMELDNGLFYSYNLKKKIKYNSALDILTLNETVDLNNNNLIKCGNCINTTNLNTTIDRNLTNYTNTLLWINNTNVAMLNQSNNFTENNTFMKNICISQQNCTKPLSIYSTDAAEGTLVLTVLDYAGTTSNKFSQETYGDSILAMSGSAMNLRSSRGNQSIPISLRAGDRIGSFFFAGNVGNGTTDYKTPSSVESWVGSGTISTTSLPSYLRFTTTPTGSTTRITRMIINSTGQIEAPYISNSSQSNSLCYNSATGLITYYPTSCTVSTESSKSNIVNVTSSLTTKLMSVQPKLYNTSDGYVHYGFSAQQIEPIFPELVSYHINYDTEYDNRGEVVRTNPSRGNIAGVQYENAVAVLTKVIQEQQVKIDSQQATLNVICLRSPLLCA